MNDLFFTDRNGNPITGKVPVQIRVHGSGDEAAARGACQRAFRVFVEEVRLSGLPYSQRAYIVPGVCSARFTHMYGTNVVDLYLVPTSTETVEDFYGGIVVKLVEPASTFAAAASSYANSNPSIFTFAWPFSQLPDTFIPPHGFEFRPSPIRTLFGDTLFTSDASVPTQFSTATPAVRALSAGEVRLVFQIQRGVTFGSTPVKDRKIRVFRIGASTALGSLVEVSSEHRYLLSATVGAGVINGWAIGGKTVTWIPALNFTGTSSPVRLCTMFLKATTLAEAKAARGFVFVAIGGKLYAFGPNTTTWVLIASAADETSQLWNRFGAVVSVTTTDDGSMTLLCSGSNYAGPCSGFQVNLLKTSTGYAISGSISLAAVTMTLPTTATATSSRSVSSTASAGSTHTVTWDRTLQTFDGGGAPIGPFSTSDTLFTWEPRNYSSTTTGFARSVSLGRPTALDPYVPRTLPAQATVIAELTVSASTSSTSSFDTAEYIHTYDPVGWEFDEWKTHWAFLKKIHTLSYSATFEIFGPASVSLSDTGSRTLTAYRGEMLYDTAVGTPDHPPTVNPSHSPTSSTSPTFPTTTDTGSRSRSSRTGFSTNFDATHYTAVDAHAQAIALSRRVVCSFDLNPRPGVITYSGDFASSGALISGTKWYYTTALGYMVRTGTESFIPGSYGWNVARSGYQVQRGVVADGAEDLTDISGLMHSSLTTTGDYFDPAGGSGLVMSEVPSGYINGPGGIGVATVLTGSNFLIQNWWSLLRSYDVTTDFELPGVSALGAWNSFEYSKPVGSSLQTIFPNFSVSSSPTTTLTTYSQTAWQTAFPAAYYPIVTETWTTSPNGGGNQLIRDFSPDYERLTPSAPCAPLFDCVLRDMRTAGFIRQQLWVAKSAVGPAAFVTNNATVIGNDVDEVPLLAVVNEWLALNAAESTAFAAFARPLTDALIHPDTLEVSLL